MGRENRKKMSHSAIKKILVRTPNWVGDAVMTLPALQALGELYNGAEISILAKKAVIPIYENNPAVADIIEYQADYKGLKGRFQLSKKLRTEQFQLAVLFQNAFDAAFISFLSRIPERVGYGRDMRSSLLTEAVPFTDEIKKLHHIDYYLNIIKSLGMADKEKRPWPRLYPRAAELAEAESFISKKGLAGKPLIGAAPGASFGPAKMWAPERFAESLIKLSEDTGAVPLIFGGPGDIKVTDKVFELIRDKVPSAQNLAGKTTLRQCIALLNKLSLFITNDSGAMHMAAALSVPTVALFGSTDPMLTGPTGKHTSVVIKKTPCSPCFERVCKPGHMNCMTAVTVEDVLTAAKSLQIRESRL